MSWAEAKWIVDSILQKVGQQPNNMRKFVVTPLSETSVGLMFLEPADSYDNGNLVCSIGGVVIRKSTNGYPQSPWEGDLVLDNKELGKYGNQNYVVNNLVSGKKYYFSAFPYSTQGVYNTSPSNENRQTGTPNTGETVNVSITIDDASAFTSVSVKCVDETDGSKTQTKQLTASNRSTSFVVAVSHKYHIEYGDMTDYIKPSNSQTKTATGGGNVSVTGGYTYFKAYINVTAPSGTNLTCTNGNLSYSGVSNGTYKFTVHKKGSWTISGNSGGDTASSSVSISSHNQTQNVTLNFVVIYGISRNVNASSPVWTRTDNSVGKNAKATVGTSPGSSDFNNCYPWSQMTKSTQGSDVMVWIPEFWYKRYLSGDIEYIKIANKQTGDYKKHPGSGVWVSAYKSSNNNLSERNVNYNIYVNMDTARRTASSKGSKWGVLDLMTLSAIQMLYLVEFATYDSQTAIGMGRSNTNSDAKTGECDTVSNGTGIPAGTNGQVGVVYRGIENLWGKRYELIDGIYPVLESTSSGFNRSYMICMSPTNYGKSATNYTKSSITYPTTTEFRIRKLGFDSNFDWAMLPDGSSTSGGSTSTYICDKCWYETNAKWAAPDAAALLLGGVPSGYSSSPHQNDAGIFAYARDLENVSQYTCRFILRK